MDPLASIAPVPGELKLAGLSFVILPPTPGDMIRTTEHMRELALARCMSPLEYVLQHTTLSVPGLALSVSEAIKLGAGGGVKANEDTVWDQYTTLEGVRWRVWYHVSLVLKDFTPEAAAGIVTAENRFDVAEQLDRALRLRHADPNAPAPATGSA